MIGLIQLSNISACPTAPLPLAPLHSHHGVFDSNWFATKISSQMIKLKDPPSSTWLFVEWFGLYRVVGNVNYAVDFGISLYILCLNYGGGQISHSQLSDVAFAFQWELKLSRYYPTHIPLEGRYGLFMVRKTRGYILVISHCVPHGHTRKKLQM